jgi:transketolase
MAGGGSGATRDAWGEAIARVGADERMVVLAGDLRDSTKVEGFIEKYPERYVECGIAEMNMIGVASGLALSGKVPWACSFSAFVTGRMEIIRVSVSYQEANVRLVGTHCGVGVGEDGYSQMALQDIASIRSLPNVAVVQPADAVETERAVEYLAEHQGPAFLRLTRQKVDDVHDQGYTFAFGRADRLRDGSDVALIGTGATVGECLKAAEALEGRGIAARVINIHTIKPIDEEAILETASECPAIVTVEDHGIWGGLGGAVAEVLAAAPGNGSRARLNIIGVRGFGESGKSEELYELHGLSGDRVADQTEAFLKGI